MKTYAGDFARFKNMLKNREPFALSRFGDGELKILMRIAVRLREFRYDPNDPADGNPRQRLLSSFSHNSCHYYVGISCPNCVGAEKFAWAKLNSWQDEDHLTWATLFVTSTAKFTKTGKKRGKKGGSKMELCKQLSAYSLKKISLCLPLFR